MKRKIVWIIAISLSLFMIASTGQAPVKKVKTPSRIEKLMSIISAKRCEREKIRSFPALRKLLESPEVNMSPALVSKVMTTLKCAENAHTHHSHILTVIDYSLPSNKKRLWVFNLRANKMLFHTYVAHGLTSGKRFSNQFSNKHNSKASSIGVYKTDQAYFGRHGLSLRLDGLEAGFNDYARGRAVVMHSAWYVNEAFIHKYGRAGRSWGCPAISKDMKKPVIDTIKHNGLLVIYYPGEKWVSHSKYLNCRHFSPIAQTELLSTTLKNPTKPERDVLFIPKNKNNTHEENEPLMIMSADDYIQTFHQKAPLIRMLRCQINGTEYIAINSSELETLIKNNQKEAFQKLSFVIPDVKLLNGRYWKTEMKFIPLGHITEIKHNPETQQYTLTFDKSGTKALKSTHQFIRWVGL